MLAFIITFIFTISVGKNFNIKSEREEYYSIAGLSQRIISRYPFILHITWREPRKVLKMSCPRTERDDPARALRSGVQCSNHYPPRLLKTLRCDVDLLLFCRFTTFYFRYKFK